MPSQERLKATEGLSWAGATRVGVGRAHGTLGEEWNYGKGEGLCRGVRRSSFPACTSWGGGGRGVWDRAQAPGG